MNWKPVEGFPGYRVSDTGLVHSEPRPRTSGILLALSPHTTGYIKVCLSCNGVVRKRFVHTLVMEAFVGPRPAGMEVRHLNGCRSDNRAENLAWGTCKENAADRVDHGTSVRGSAMSTAKLTEDQVRAILQDTRKYCVIALDYDVSSTTIGVIKRRKAWRHVEAPFIALRQQGRSK
jgi:hypothetical protein